MCIALACLIAGCASGPGGPARSAGTGDGPPERAPAEPPPDAQPRVEPFARGPNRPYVVRGREYTPVVADVPMRERGLASWYGRQFHGKPTSSGEPYDMYAMTAAHPTMPIPSYARVRHVASGREVIVRVNDRGPFHANRIIDVSYMAALKLGFAHRGSALVEVERLTHEEIRAGTWRRETPAPAVQVAGADGAPPRPAAAALPPAAGSPAPTPATPRAEPVAAGAADLAVERSADPGGATASSPTTGPAAPRAPLAAAGFWVQLGAFRQRDGAQGFHHRVSSELDWLAPMLSVFEDAAVFRLQAGPYRSREEAAGVAERVRGALRLVPLVIERP